MIKGLKKLFSATKPETETSVSTLGRDARYLAAAVLMVDAALQDGDFSEDEVQVVLQILQRSFSLSESDAGDLLEMAKAKHEDAVEMHTFTRSVKNLFPFEERVEMIEMLWEVAYADGVLSEYESSLVRKVAGLIYVSDRDRGEARKRVVARLDISE